MWGSINLTLCASSKVLRFSICISICLPTVTLQCVIRQTSIQCGDTCTKCVGTYVDTVMINYVSRFK